MDFKLVKSSAFPFGHSVSQQTSTNLYSGPGCGQRQIYMTFVLEELTGRLLVYTEVLPKARGQVSRGD